MAKNQIPFQYFLKQDTSSNPKKSGKYYGRRFNPTVLGTRGLAEHMISHGVIAERSEVEDVLNALPTCIPELLKQGMNVKLTGLGSFRITLTSKGAASIEAYSVQKHVKGANMRFVPDSTSLDNKTRKAFRDQCSLECVGYEVVTTEGNKTIKTIKPISAYVPAP